MRLHTAREMVHECSNLFVTAMAESVWGEEEEKLISLREYSFADYKKCNS